MESKIIIVHKVDLEKDTSHGFVRGWGINSATTGSVSISMAYGTLTKSIRAEPHYHPFETAIYIVSGNVRVHLGITGNEFVDASEGDFIYIPPMIVHSPENIGDIPMQFVVARNAPDEVALIPSPE
jgi:uncharacterized RmlC-like cupin family protein